MTFTGKQRYTLKRLQELASKNDDLRCDKAIQEMKLRKDLLFLQKRYFKTIASMARVFGVGERVLTRFFHGSSMNEAGYKIISHRLTKVQKLCKEADKYDAAKNFENLDFDKNKDGEPNDR
jgi:hypothetical protein